MSGVDHPYNGCVTDVTDNLGAHDHDVLSRRDGVSGPVSAGDVAASQAPHLETSEIVWLSTQDAARRLGVTPRTLYRFIDEGQLPAYRFGRVIRLQLSEVHEFIERCRIQPGSLEHLYPESVGASGSHDE